VTKRSGVALSACGVAEAALALVFVVIRRL
jgi:hypothetical protein